MKTLTPSPSPTVVGEGDRSAFQPLSERDNLEKATTDRLSTHSHYAQGEQKFKRVRKTKVSRSLRIEETLSEKLLWEQIRNRKVFGYKFRRQHVIRGFVVDFYCSDLNLVLEIDGKIHENQMEYDRLRQEVIERENVEFLRINVDKIDEVIPIIVDWIQKWERGKSC